MKAYLIYNVDEKTYYEPRVGMKHWKEEDSSGGFWSKQIHELCYIASKVKAKKILDMLVWASRPNVMDIDGSEGLHYQLLEVEVDPDMGYRFKNMGADVIGLSKYFKDIVADFKNSINGTSTV